MKWYINDSKQPRIINNSMYNKIVIYPNMVFREDDYSIKHWNYYKEFNLDNLYNQEQITIYRLYALGDLIQLAIICRNIKKTYNIKKINIITSEKFCFILRKLFTDLMFYPETRVLWHKKEDGYLISLNSILEKDHNKDNYQCFNHRMHNMLDYFNCMHVTNKNLSWDYNMNIKKHKYPILKNKPNIGFQIRGSGPIKTLPYNLVKRIVRKLSLKYRIYLIDQDSNKGFEGENIVNTCGKLSVIELTSLLQDLDCCITMDSGVLWLAHLAKCPVLTLLGATRESERISLHPLYPSQAKSINLAEMVGCEPCFETKDKCKGKITCMNNITYDKLIIEIENKLRSILSWQDVKKQQNQMK